VVAASDGKNYFVVNKRKDGKLSAVVNGKSEVFPNLTSFARSIKAIPGVEKLQYYIAGEEANLTPGREVAADKRRIANDNKIEASKEDFKALVGKHLAKLAKEKIPVIEQLLMKSVTMPFAQKALRSGTNYGTSAGDVMMQGRIALDWMKTWSAPDKFSSFLYSNEFERMIGKQSGFNSYNINRDEVNEKIVTLKGRSEIFKALKKMISDTERKLTIKIEDAESDAKDEQEKIAARGY